MSVSDFPMCRKVPVCIQETRIVQSVQLLVTSRTVRVSNPSRGKKFSSFQNETRPVLGLTCSMIIDIVYLGSKDGGALS